MRKLIVATVFVIGLAGIAFAADRDRHANITDPKAPAAAAQCKSFYGLDDNRTACADYCAQYVAANEGATCTCDEGRCPADDHGPS
jgi:hypothetical protein